MVKTCISPANKLLHAASLVLMQSSYQWSCIQFVFKHVAPVPGKTISGQATPLYCVAVPQFCSCGHPLWIFSTLGIRLGGAKPLPPGEVWKFNTSNVEKFSARFSSHLSWELSNRWWANLTNGSGFTMLANAGQKCIQNFPQNNLIQTATFANMPAWQPQKPPKGGCKTRFSRFWSTQHFYVWGTWRRIAHWNPQPPSGSCELLIRIANLSRCNDSKNTELAHRGSDPKISWSDSTRETESGPIEEANHFSEVHFCLKSYRQQIGLPEDFSVLSMPLCVLIILGSTWVGSLVIQSFYNSLLSLWCFAYCT